MADIRNLADEEAMQLVQDGNPRAFELIYDRHGGAAFSLAYRMVGNRVTAEDITQEAFLSIWRSRLRYDQARGSVRTWVLGIVHNRAIDALRRNVVHDRRRETMEGVEERHEAKERTDVEVAYFGGFSHSQIADLLNEPIGTVKGRMRLGLEKMRRQLSEGIAQGGIA